MKNAIFYHATLPNPEDVALGLAERPYADLMPTQLERTCFDRVDGEYFQKLTAIEPIYRFCFRIDKKVIPKSAVDKQTALAIDGLQHVENRLIGRQERKAIREDVILQLAPTALATTATFFGYYHYESRTLMLDTASPGKADDVISQLIQLLGSLEVQHPQNAQHVAAEMTHRLHQFQSDGDAFGEYAPCRQLRLVRDTEGPESVTFKDTEFDTAPIAEYTLDPEWRVDQIGLAAGDANFLLTSAFRFKSIHYGDPVDELTAGAENADEWYVAGVKAAVVRKHYEQANSLFQREGGDWTYE